ncbi:TITAN-like protein isoform X1 [Quillaja saponaria]|uniref:TITAN-like protein isoform X1 n=1 Tax=Quillaja saponaria TaxID=32244 RepID=A0AAD7P879_QUISA|nr:TITAN-like protein isoform X1 [Quillaja saponaria]
MGEQSQATESNPKPEFTKQRNSNNSKKKKMKSEFEFCKVCKLNHDQGQRHKYFPNHKKSLSTFLSRFQTKLSDIRFFLKNPIPLRPEYASRNRFWCVFCDADIDELGSLFACTNAINHFSSDDHLKNLKHFLWKYGGEMDSLDTFRILDADIVKWEKKCKALKDESLSSSGGNRGQVLGPSNDIHNQLNSGYIDSFENNYTQSVKSILSNSVLPLQYYTNEYQVSHSGPPEVGAGSLFPHDVTSSLHLETCSGTNEWNLKYQRLTRNTQSLICSSGQSSTDDYFSNIKVYEDGRTLRGENSSQGLQNLTQVLPMPPETAGGNVHSGAPPPWFEGRQLNAQIELGNLVSSSNELGKSKRLNPKRVGAAWAEKRKIEMEMEKRGEIVRNECDPNWLPNFGRVWQSGSRKESRKEFETEKQKLFKVESQPEMPAMIQPYISKRMRRDL